MISHQDRSSWRAVALACVAGLFATMLLFDLRGGVHEEYLGRLPVKPGVKAITQNPRPVRCFYDVLRIPRDATDAQIVKAAKEMSFLCHPGKLRALLRLHPC